MTKNSQVFLKHILESIDWIEKETAGLSEEQFKENVPIQDAVIRRLEIIWDTVSQALPEFKKQIQELAGR